MNENVVKMRVEPLTLKENLLKDKRMMEFAEKQAKQNDPNNGGYFTQFSEIKQRINAILTWAK